jgi:hypothetical protein
MVVAGVSGHKTIITDESALAWLFDRVYCSKPYTTTVSTIQRTSKTGVNAVK